MAVVLSIILPDNHVLPFVGLASLMLLLAMVTPFCKRNMSHMFITGALIVTCILYVETGISQEYTQVVMNSHIPVPEGMTEIINIVGSATTPVGWLAVKFGEFFSATPQYKATQVSRGQIVVLCFFPLFCALNNWLSYAPSLNI